MILYFFRHALAGDRNEWHEDDRLRPITETGKKRTKAAGKKLVDLIPDLDAIISSPLTRARQTADLLAEALEMEAAIDERLSPGFSAVELAKIVEERPDAEALLLVGHEPDFSETISALIGGGEVVVKKGSLARVDLFDVPALEGQLVWLIPPKVLGD
jgi:phosphohistidine phosphatase